MSDASTTEIEITETDRKKAQVFFDRARAVAETGQHDYAIEMYLEGLRLDPENAEAYAWLRRISLQRKATGGKPIGPLKAMGLKKTGKDDRQNLINALKLLSYDPGNAQHMELIARAAQRAGLRQPAVWIGPILLHANREGKNDVNVFLLLKDMYKDIGEYKLSLDALHYASASRPDDADLQHELRELAASMTMAAGKYGTGDFRTSMRDADRQRAIMEEETSVRSVEALSGPLARARAEYEAAPDQPGKLMKLVDVLARTEDLANENEAIELLEKAYRETDSYRFRYNAEELRIRQMQRLERNTREAVEAAGSDKERQQLKQQLEEFGRDRLEMELKHYQTAIKAYPTDLRLRYEVGKRLFNLGRYDEAIPMLQQAQADAKYRDDAIILLGRSFLEADFVEEAADTLRGRIESYNVQGDKRSKELHYWYARAEETKGDIQAAIKSYSQIAQWDFGYRDVQKRIKELRAKAKSGEGPAAASEGPG